MERVTGPAAPARILILTLLVGACADGGTLRSAPAVSDPTGVPSLSIAPAPTVGTPAETTPSASIAVTLETTVAADEVALTIAGRVRRGELAVVNAKTAANAECSITVTSASGTSVQALSPKHADSAGNVSWSWTVEMSMAPGMWPVEVTCSTPSGIRAIARELLRVE